MRSYISIIKFCRRDMMEKKKYLREYYETTERLESALNTSALNRREARARVLHYEYRNACRRFLQSLIGRA